MIQPIIDEDGIKICPTCKQEIEEDVSLSGWEFLVFLLIIALIILAIALAIPWIGIFWFRYIEWVGGFR